MKKVFVLPLTVLFIFLLCDTGSASTAYFQFDSTLDFTQLTGIDIFMDLDDPINNLSLEVSFQKDGGAIPTHDYKGLGAIHVPYAEWYQTSYGAYLTLIDKPSFFNSNPDNAAPNAMRFKPGLVFSLKSAEPYNIEKIQLLSDFDISGYYQGTFNVSSTIFEEGIMYNISNVPIPSTLLLLGGGIVALVGGTRRKIGGK